MNGNIDSRLKEYWPWGVAVLGVYAFLTAHNPDATDYGFFGWLISFPFVVEAQRRKNRRNGDG